MNLPVRVTGSALSRATLVVVIVSAFALGSARPARAAPVACGDTIIASVKLTANLACGGVALYVLGDNITVNFEGYAITGGGLFIAGQNVVVKNGTMKGAGASVSGSFNRESATFLRMTFAGGCIDGFQASVSVVSSSIRGCPRDALNVAAGLASVAGSWIVHNGGNGVVGAFNGVNITNSFVSENGGYGVLALGQSAYLTNSFFSGNAILGSSPYGVDRIYVQGNKFRNSPVIAQDTMTVADLGGNLCAVGSAPFLPCVFP